MTLDCWHHYHIHLIEGSLYVYDIKVYVPTLEKCRAKLNKLHATEMGTK